MKKIFLTVSFLLIMLTTLQAQTVERYNRLMQRTEIYRDGVMIGYTRENRLLNQREHYDSQHNSIGYSRNNRLLNQTEHYDNRHQRTGYTRENRLLNQVEHYDNRHQRTGYSRWNNITRQWEYTATK